MEKMSMDNAYVYEEKKVIHELTQGLQMAELLKVSLHSPEARDFFIQKILSSYENALSALSAGQPLAPALQAPCLPGSSISFGSPGRGENTISKKRKWSTTWEDELKICSDNGLDGNNDDGFNWRKYGQKDIQGAKFPRSYYRCSYRNAQKCFATKQVQRKDDDPTKLEIVYNGKHTCNHSASPSPPPSPKKYEIMPTHQQKVLPRSPHETLSNLRANLTVITSDMGGDTDTDTNTSTAPSTFSFPSTSSGLMEDYQLLQFPSFDDELLQGYSPSFISPVTSESNIFTEWGSSQSLNFLADVDTDFEFNSLF